ncbi:MAG: hypothetical protein EXR65_05140 [Dehalococcoidia bacterium]|nr:hypothetical protein [Dehalococcoidia bacterium]
MTAAAAAAASTATTAAPPPALTATGTAAPGGDAGGNTRASRIQNLALESMTISAGTTVAWTNADAGIPHTVTADRGEFNGDVTSGPFRFTCDRAGVFGYHCNIHPSMRATITVQ